MEINNINVRHWRHQVRINQFIYALLAEEKCEEAGVAAALASRKKTTPLKVPLQEIREMLDNHGAIVPDV